jgi:hypothetical protein
MMFTVVREVWSLFPAAGPNPARSGHLFLLLVRTRLGVVTFFFLLVRTRLGVVTFFVLLVRTRLVVVTFFGCGSKRARSGHFFPLRVRTGLVAVTYIFPFSGTNFFLSSGDNGLPLSCDIY